MDLMKAQTLQNTTCTRSVAVPADATSVSVGVGFADPNVAIRAELQGLLAGKWVPLLDATFPGTDKAHGGDRAERVRLVIDPSTPVTILASIDIS